jgi:hypothetical protein
LDLALAKRKKRHPKPSTTLVPDIYQTVYLLLPSTVFIPLLNLPAGMDIRLDITMVMGLEDLRLRPDFLTANCVGQQDLPSK